MRARSRRRTTPSFALFFIFFVFFVIVVSSIGIGVASPTVAHAADETGGGDKGGGGGEVDVAGGVGAMANGLPGIGRVAVAAPKQFPHAAVAIGVGYGLTEAQKTNANASEDGTHHRASGSFALMAQPLRFLAAALMLDGRYDKHPDDALGSSSSGVGEPRLFVRGNGALSKSFALGAQLGLWIPGAEAPSLRPEASTLDALLLATYAPEGTDLALAINAGYRLDRSGHALEDRERPRLRSGDRLSLHLSDFDALLLGVGASKRLGAPHTALRSIEVLGEVTWDVLLGTNAPKAIESPLRLGLGGRYHMKEEDEYVGAMQIELRGEIALDERPKIGPNDALAPIDPRFAITIGFRWAPALVVKAKPTSHGGGGVGGVGGGGGTTVAAASTMRGRVTTEGGEPIANAHVTVTMPPATAGAAEDPGSDQRSADTTADGSFTISDLRPGSARVVAKATGYEDATVEATIPAGGAAGAAGGAGRPPIVVDLVMKKLIKAGQLRGLVRSFNGKALAATIRVEPIGVETKTDADGTFQIDVPPGAYEVVVAAPGHVGQRRPVQVEENGVTILNADLRAGKDPPKEAPP